MSDYIRVSAFTLLRFQLACKAGETDQEALIPLPEWLELVEAVRRKMNERHLFVTGGRVYVDGRRIDSIKPQEADLIEAIQEHGFLTTEELFRYFPGIDPEKKTAKQAIRNRISKLNQKFDPTGVAILADGSGRFRIYQ